MTRGQHDSTSFQRGESLFWDIADELLEEPGVTRSTMMGYPCLRHNGAFFACVERTTGYLIVKLPADRVQEVVSSGQAASFAPNGRTLSGMGGHLSTEPKRMEGHAERSAALRQRLSARASSLLNI